MFPQENTNNTEVASNRDEYTQLENEFVSETKSQFSTLLSEIADRNKRVNENDAYIYGDLLERMLDIPVGHDFTPVNWLRRTVEIHRTQFMGNGFAVDSTYNSQDINDVPIDPQTNQPDENEKQRLIIENEKNKSFAEARRQVIEAIFRDNGGTAFWANAAENASAVGDTVIKGWFDEDEKKYKLQQIESIENFYALWARDDFRSHTAVGFIYQIDKADAMRLYGVPKDTPTSPLGFPLAVLTSANTQRYVSTQPMVTVMEVTGKVPGWCSKNGVLARCKMGDETELNVIIVSNLVYQLIDDPKKIPHYYILPNKRQRRRPWGMPDISGAAIQLNLTYIETLSDWRTLANKVNFPKWKAFGFAPGVQMPKPKPRAAELLPLVAGQDLQPLELPNSAGLGEQDFLRQLNEVESQFVREVGISRQLFDMPDENSNSNQAMLTSMKSISDLTDAKRRLWEPIITQICTDALTTLSNYDDNIKALVNTPDAWHIKINWPSMLNRDDPSYHAIQLNMFNAGLMSVETYLENVGYDKQELDRIKEEMEDKVTAAIHGHALPELAQLLILPYSPMRNIKQSVNWRADMTPQQAANLADENQWQNGPFGASAGPQGAAGIAANDNAMNTGFVNGNAFQGGTPITLNPQGQSQPLDTSPQPGMQLPNSAGQTANSPQPEMINTGASSNGAGIVSQPGSGAPATSAKGKLKQREQRRGQ